MNTQISKGIQWLTGFFLLFFPFLSTKSLVYGTVNGKFFLLIAFVAVLLLLSAVKIFKQSSFTDLVIQKNFLFFSFLGLLPPLLLSTLFGVYPERSFLSDILRGSGALFLLYVFLMAVVLRSSVSISGWSVIRRFTAVSAGLFSLFTIIGTAGFGYVGNAFGIPFQSTGLSLGNETFAGVYLLLSIGLTYIEYIKQDTSVKWKRILVGILALQICSPLFIGWKAIFSGEIFNSLYQIFGLARSSSVTLLLLGLYMFGIYLYGRLPERFASSKKRIYIAWITAWSIGVIYVIVTLFVPGSFVYEKHVELTGVARPVVWNIGIEAFKQKPVFGWGPENFRIAFVKNYNPELSNGEVWFDRAHNFFIDTAVSYGAFGILVFVIFGIAFFSVITRAHKKGIISFAEANILGALFVAHILQIQTSFDTVSTYCLLGVVLAYVLSLETSLGNGILLEKKGSPAFFKAIAIVLLVATLSGFWFFGYKEYDRQRSLLKAFLSPNSTLQSEFLKVGLSRVSSFESIRIGSASFIKGTIAGVLTAKTNAEHQKLVNMARPHVEIYKDTYKRALAEFPDDYRLRMNYAYLLIISTALFGEKDLDEARAIVIDSYDLSPRNPITYAMHSLVELYSGNTKKAGELIAEARAIKPDAEFAINMEKYIQAQIKSFPEISIVKLENL